MKKISRNIFSNCGAFKNPKFRPQPGEIIVSDENMWYEFIRFVWTYEEDNSQCAIAYIKQISSEIKKDVLLVHHVPFISETSRNIELFAHYQNYIKCELPYIKHVFVPDRKSGKFAIECIHPSDAPQELLEKCIALQKQYLESGKP